MAERDDVSDRVFNACLTLIELAGLLVPRRQRHDWRREWHAEIWMHGRRATTSATAPVAAANTPPPDDALRVGRRRRPNSPDRDLMYRSLGAFRHAAWLRSQDWKPDMLVQDLRYAVRSLLRAPTFTIVALLTLGVGIGASTVVFNMLDSVLLHPYPFENADELVSVFATDKANPGDSGSLSYPNFLAIRESGVFDDIAAWDWEPMNLRTTDETIYVGVGQVTGSLFDVLRAKPILGRGFTAEEDVPGQGGVAILSESLWNSRFGGDHDVVGTQVTLDGIARIIIGVMPHEIGYPSDGVQMWVPLGVTIETAPAGSNWLGAIARLESGSTVDRAAAALDPLATRLENEFPGSNRDMGFAVQSLRDARVGEIRPFFLVLFGVVGFVMLIVCANVANLLLARASAREREISVRLALGASRTRLVRQLLTESLLLSLGGLVIGFAFSSWAINAIFATIPTEIPGWVVVETNFTDVAFMATVALAAAVLFGLVPALQSTRPNLSGALADSSARTAGSRRRRFTRNVLVVAEVAISMMLLVGAGLMAMSFVELANISPGFEVENRLIATMQMPRGKYDTQQERLVFYREMLDRLAALPSVEGVAAITRIPLGGSSNTNWFMYEGQDPDEARRNPSALNNSISPGYFGTMGIELIRGREFTDVDNAAATQVIIVNNQLAETYFPDGNVIGQRLTVDGENWMDVVGVVADVRHRGLDRPGRLQIYRPYEQAAQGRLSLIVKTSGDPEALAPIVRAEVRDIDPDQALYNLRSFEAAIAESVWMEGFFARLMSIFAVIAAGIAAVGIYGVTAYSVSRRTQELGIRLALGARRTHIMAMVIRQSMTVVLIGVVIGLALAFAEGALLEAVLVGVSGTAPLAYAAVTALVLIVGLVAAWLPARRATRLDPIKALRDD